ncbi:MAG: hypothetical protein ACP5IX_02475 [Patescibacteria group bacterium]
MMLKSNLRLSAPQFSTISKECRGIERGITEEEQSAIDKPKYPKNLK